MSFLNIVIIYASFSVLVSWLTIVYCTYNKIPSSKTDDYILVSITVWPVMILFYAILMLAGSARYTGNKLLEKGRKGRG